MFNAPKVDRMKKTILIIDYHSDIAEMLGFTLSLEKYTVKIARKKDDEVKILQEDLSIGCVLIDWRSPTLPFDDYVAEVRKIRPDIPIILLTNSPGVMEHAQHLGIKCLITEPFDIDALHRALQEADMSMTAGQT